MGYREQEQKTKMREKTLAATQFAPAHDKGCSAGVCNVAGN